MTEAKQWPENGNCGHRPVSPASVVRQSKLRLTSPVAVQATLGPLPVSDFTPHGPKPGTSRSVLWGPVVLRPAPVAPTTLNLRQCSLLIERHSGPGQGPEVLPEVRPAPWASRPQGPGATPATFSRNRPYCQVAGPGPWELWPMAFFQSEPPAFCKILASHRPGRGGLVQNPRPPALGA